MNVKANLHSTTSLSLLASVFVLGAFPSGTAAQDDPPESIELTGIVRDFHEREHPQGHPDFEHRPENGFGRYAGNIATTISEDNKPLFTGNGAKVTNQWRDSDHRQICYCLYDPSLGDIEGSFGIASTGGITSAESFGQWYRDELGVNMSAPLTLTLVRQLDGIYVFDDTEDPYYNDLGGFFPIDDQLFGNSGSSGPFTDHNYHFTFELHTEFTYDAGGAQYFKFIGDDGVSVFINGQLVIDLGGIHADHDQYVDVSRLGLVDGQTYSLDFFFAERFRSHSHFRIETNLLLVGITTLPTVTALFD